MGISILRAEDNLWISLEDAFSGKREKEEGRRKKTLSVPFSLATRSDDLLRSRWVQMVVRSARSLPQCSRGRIGRAQLDPRGHPRGHPRRQSAGEISDEHRWLIRRRDAVTEGDSVLQHHCGTAAVSRSEYADPRSQPQRAADPPDHLVIRTTSVHLCALDVTVLEPRDTVLAHLEQSCKLNLGEIQNLPKLAKAIRAHFVEHTSAHVKRASPVRGLLRSPALSVPWAR